MLGGSHHQVLPFLCCLAIANAPFFSPSGDYSTIGLTSGISLLASTLYPNPALTTERDNPLTGILGEHGDLLLFSSSSISFLVFPQSRLPSTVRAIPFGGCWNASNLADFQNAIVLVGTGNCSYAEKALWAQSGNASGIIVTQTPDAPPDAPGDVENVTIASVVVSSGDAQVLFGYLNSTVTLQLVSRAAIDPAAVFLVVMGLFCVSVAAALRVEERHDIHHYQRVSFQQDHEGNRPWWRALDLSRNLPACWTGTTIFFGAVFLAAAVVAVVATALSLILGSMSSSFTSFQEDARPTTFFSPAYLLRFFFLVAAIPSTHYCWRALFMKTPLRTAPLIGTTLSCVWLFFFFFLLLLFSPASTFLLWVATHGRSL